MGWGGCICKKIKGLLKKILAGGSSSGNSKRRRKGRRIGGANY